ncbi:MAG: hypothetical protein JXB05_07165 [Myxococcaceae bacterium]|nr:hypothetical protein [Myxococcaceae bacterium]
MRSVSPGVRAGVVLAATLLPLCVIAAPLRLQLVRCDSSITDVPELTAQAFLERTTSGLTKAIELEKDKATLVSAGELEGADLLVAGKLGRSGEKFRLVYIVQTNHEPKLHKQVAFEFTSSRLSERGMTVMAQEVLAEAVKLEEARKEQAAMLPPPEVASAPAPGGAQSASPAPAAEAPSQPVASAPAETYEEEAEEERVPMRRGTTLDVGLAAGFNSPSGVYGLEGEYRPMEQVGFQLGVGAGAWGYRVSPLVRAYPFGRRSLSPFAEGGLSFNLGTESSISYGNGQEQTVDLLFTPVAILSFGVRANMGDHAYITPRVGWGWRLRQDNVRSRDGQDVDAILDLVNTLSQHGGFLFGLTAGVSFM